MHNIAVVLWMSLVWLRKGGGGGGEGGKVWRPAIPPCTQHCCCPMDVPNLAEKGGMSGVETKREGQVWRLAIPAVLWLSSA